MSFTRRAIIPPRSSKRRSWKRRSGRSSGPITRTMPPPSTAWPMIYGPKVATPTPSRSTGDRWRSRRRRSVPTIPMSRRRSTTWLQLYETKAATPTPSRSTGARWRSARRRSVPTIPTSRRRSTTWLRSTRPKAATPTPSRSTGARWRSREGARSRPSRRRASLNNLAVLYKPKAATPTPSRSTGARWRSTRRRSAPTIPTSRCRSTTWLRLYYAQGRYADAEPLYRRSLAILGEGARSRPSRRRDVAQQPGCALQDQGRYADAEPLYRRALAIQEKALGPDHPDVATSLNNLAELYRAQGRYADAEPLYRRSLAIDEKALGPDHPDVAASLNNLAALYRDQGRYADALPLVQTTIAHGRANPSVALPVLFGAQGNGLISAAQALDDALNVVQRASQSSAAAAVNKLAVRLAAGTDRLAQLVRKDQDLAGEAEALDKAIIAAVSKEPAKRDGGYRAADQGPPRGDRRRARGPAKGVRRRVPGLRGAGEPAAVDRQGHPEPAVGRRGARAVLGRRQGELRLCADARRFRLEDDPARCAGAVAEGRSLPPRTRCRGAQPRAWREWSARRPKPTSADCRGRNAIRLLQPSAPRPLPMVGASGASSADTAVRPRGRARALRDAARSGRGAGQGQAAPARRALGRAHGAAVPSAGDGEAGARGARVQRPQRPRRSIATRLGS